MDAPEGSFALLGEGRAKSCSDQKQQIKTAAVSGTDTRCASFLNFSLLLWIGIQVGFFFKKVSRKVKRIVNRLTETCGRRRGGFF